MYLVVNIQNETSNYNFLFQVCIRVNEEKYYDFDPFHVYGSYHELYYYNEIDCKHDIKIPGLKLQSKIVRNALGTVKEIKEVSTTLQKKVSEIKKESKERYKNFMDERYSDEINHYPNTPLSPKNVFSDGVSNEALKQVESQLMRQMQSFQVEGRERFSKIEETLGYIQGSKDAEMERLSKIEETLQSIQDSKAAEMERFSKMKETLGNIQGFQDAERKRFSKLEETLENIQGFQNTERERFSQMEEALRSCIQDSFQNQA